jgi:hypothetical protein
VTSTLAPLSRSRHRHQAARLSRAPDLAQIAIELSAELRVDNILQPHAQCFF